MTQSLALNCEPSSMKAGSQGSEGRCLLGSQVIFDQATWQIELRRSTAGELNQADKLAGSLAYYFPSHASVESTDKRVVFDHIAHRTARERASRLDGGLFGQPWYDASACTTSAIPSPGFINGWAGLCGVFPTGHVSSLLRCSHFHSLRSRSHPRCRSPHSFRRRVHSATAAWSRVSPLMTSQRTGRCKS